MGCKCAERRQLIGQAVQNLRQGNTQAVKQNAQRFTQTIRTDLAQLRAAMAARRPR